MIRDWLPSLLTIFIPTTGLLCAPTELPWLPVVKHVRSQEERIVLGEVPGHLMLALSWEESNMRPEVVRAESDGTCSKGILQRNGPCTERNSDTDLDEAIQIAEGFWENSRHNWQRTKLAFRRGHL